MAVKFLGKKGYRIEERNFRTRFGEVDIVCWDGEILVFVEVKTKKGHDFGEPEEMVNKSKLAKVKRMGEIYIKNYELGIKNNGGNKWNGGCRIDVVAVVLGEGDLIERIDHYEAVD